MYIEPICCHDFILSYQQTVTKHTEGKKYPQNGILIDTIHIHIKTSFAFVANAF